MPEIRGGYVNVEWCIRQMSDNAERIRLLVQGISEEQARWRPDPASWSILEVINHLYDEERQDFRVRLDIILHRPDEPWPGIDPAGWVRTRNYNERDLDRSLQNFLNERQASLRWLRNFSSPNWDAQYQAHFGAIRAGDMFAAWVSHDHLHMRQLVELHHAYTVQRVVPYQTTYAGDW